MFKRVAPSVESKIEDSILIYVDLENREHLEDHIEIWLKGRDGRNLSFFYPWKKRLVHFKHFLLYINTRIRFHHDLNYGVSILCKLHINFVVLFLLLIKTVFCF